MELEKECRLDRAQHFGLSCIILKHVLWPFVLFLSKRSLFKLVALWGYVLMCTMRENSQVKQCPSIK